ncbi:MAG: cadherin-like domain-containing protein [Gammaproteobacteria bacterium]|nr:cadherin-like domain-containing protein [Gammaproteobacteria bacterium]
MLATLLAALVWTFPLPVHADPVVSATKTDALQVDNDSDTFADPGDTIRYTVTITNSGDMATANSNLNDTIDAHTSLVAGSIKSTPIARNDSYDAIGNVGITVPAGSGVLVNDNDPDGGSVSAIAAAGASANGGSFAIASDGSFSYLPPAGFEGADSFGYTIQDADANMDPATVFINVSDVIWFVDTSAGAGGSGVLGNPFNNLTGASGYGNAADDPGDIIFLYTGSGNYTGGITLKDSQKLVGQGATTSLAAVAGLTVPTHSNTLPSTGGTSPVITNSSGTGVALASGNLVSGLDVSNTSGFGLSGTGVAALTLSKLKITNSGTNGIQLNNLSGAAGFDSVTVDGSATRNVLIENNTGTTNVTVTNSSFKNAASEVGLDFHALGSANITFSVSGSSFYRNRSVQLKALAEDNSTINATINGSNTFEGDPAVTGNSGVDLDAVDLGVLIFDVSGNTFQPIRSQVINIFTSGGGTATGKVIGNTILGSSVGAGVRVVSEVTDVAGFNPGIVVQIDSNNISNVQGSGLAGIHVESRDGTGTVTGTANVQATINNNNVTINGADTVIQARANGGNTLCLNVTNNTAAGSATSPFSPFGSTHYIGNPVIPTNGPGNLTYQGYISGNLGGTWNANGNSPTLGSGNAGEAYIDGTQPTSGTCVTVP